jgi:CHAD domain-containing protein
MNSPAKQDPDCFSLVLKRCWKTFLKRRKRCRSHASEETVHQYRVASRRLLAELRLLKAALPGLKIGRARRLLNASRKELGELRDTQVQRELLRRCAPATADVNALKVELKDRERRLCRKACTAIKRFRIGKLEEDIRRLQLELASRSADARSHRRMLRLATECAQEAFDGTLRLLARVDYSRPKTVHKLRIAFKRFRYTVESLPRTMVPLRYTSRHKLSTYQDAMGRIQDLEVLANTVIDFSNANPDQATKMIPLLRDLESRRTRAIAAFRRGSARLASFWPPSGPLSAQPAGALAEAAKNETPAGALIRSKPSGPPPT